MNRAHRVFLESLLVIAVTEIAVMFLLPLLAPAVDEFTAAALDAFLLTAIAGPIILWRLTRSAVPGRGPVADAGNRAVLFQAGLVLVIGLFLTGVAVYRVQHEIRADAASRFERLGERLVAELDRRTNAPVYGLRGIRGLYAASNAVERREFRAFVESRDLPGEFAGLRGLGFVQRVMRGDLPAFVQRERADDAPGFEVHASGAAPDLYVIRFIDPLARNRAAWGYDVGSEPLRRAALERAIASGEPTLTERIALRQDENQGAGFLYLLAIYRNGTHPATAAGRKEALVGLAYAPIVVDEWMAGIGAAADDMLDVEIYDGDVSVPANRIHVQKAAAAIGTRGAHLPVEPALTATRTLVVGGRTWTVGLRAGPRFVAGINYTEPVLLGMGGMALSLLLALLVWSLGLGKVRAQLIAQEMTVGLSRAKERAESAMVEARGAREQVQAFLDCAPVSIFAVDAAGIVRYSNRGIGAYDRNEVLGCSWLRFVPPEQWAPLEQVFNGVLATGMPGICALTVPGVDGAWLSYACRIGPRYHDGEVIGAVIAAQDVTEEQRVQGELAASQRLATVGSLAAGIAHEINTPVQFVSDSVHFLRDASMDVFRLVDAFMALHQAVLADAAADKLAELAADATALMAEADLEYLRDNVPRAFERGLDGLDRVATIVRSMKEFSHPAQKEMAAVDINRAIQSTLTVGCNEYKYVADIDADFGDIPWVMCHVNCINQAVLNIIVNAAHAIGDVVQGTDARGRISVRTFRDGDDVVISIRDTGGGIPEQARSRVFDPFFTTKDVGRGTGQGLAIAWALIKEKHGGDLSFVTVAGEGTTFFIRLPIAGRPVARPAGQDVVNAGLQYAI